MVKFNQKGDFRKLTGFFERVKQSVNLSNLDQYGKEGVQALQIATPVDTGTTSQSWNYDIHRQRGRVSIAFQNSNINKGVNIAIILQYGHATRNGGWIEGRDYINPAIQPVFDKIVNEAWREVTKE